MFGYFDLCLMIVFAIYVAPATIKNAYRRSKILKMIPNKIPDRVINRLDNPVVPIKRYNCCKCKTAVTILLKPPTSFATSMGMGAKKRKIAQRLCDECNKRFEDYERNALQNDHLAPVGNPIIKLIVLEKFIEEKSLGIDKVLDEYDRYDKDLKSAVQVFYNKDFDGDIFEMLDAAKLLLGYPVCEEVPL